MDYFFRPWYEWRRPELLAAIADIEQQMHDLRTEMPFYQMHMDAADPLAYSHMFYELHYVLHPAYLRLRGVLAQIDGIGG